MRWSGEAGGTDVVSQQMLEERIGYVERDLARRGEQIDRIERDITKMGNGIDKLLERDARRPDALTWRALAAVCGGALTIALVGHWLIAQAPAVQDLGRRVDKLDDADIGRVTRIEQHLSAVAPGWGAMTVSKARR